MLLPTKGVSSDRALMTVGSKILEELRDPMSVSALWERFSIHEHSSHRTQRITFDWFTLALAALYAMRLVDTSDEGFLRRTHVS
ncbi:ABC-three component system middle component 6 [Rhodococcus sp. 5A-K4]